MKSEKIKEKKKQTTTKRHLPFIMDLHSEKLMPFSTKYNIITLLACAASQIKFIFSR